MHCPPKLPLVDWPTIHSSFNVLQVLPTPRNTHSSKMCCHSCCHGLVCPLQAATSTACNQKQLFTCTIYHALSYHVIHDDSISHHPSIIKSSLNSHTASTETTQPVNITQLARHTQWCCPARVQICCGTRTHRNSASKCDMRLCTTFRPGCSSHVCMSPSAHACQQLTTRTQTNAGMCGMRLGQTA